MSAASEKWPLIWLDCVGLANIGLIEEIGKIFGLHPLALEDAVNTGQRSKTDFFDDHAFFVLSMIDDVKTGRYEQISFFFGENFVVTFQEREGDPFEPVRRRIRESNPSRLRHRKADYLAYALIDAVVDSYFPVVDATGDTVDRIEDELLASPQKHQIGQLHGLRRATNLLKRTLWPLRDALATLIRSDASFISAETKVYFNDTLDHSIRLTETVESQRETMIGLIEMHLSFAQSRTNEIIGVLDHRIGDLHSADLPGRHMGHEFRPLGLAVEHAGIAVLLRLSDRSGLHGFRCADDDFVLPLEEVAMTKPSPGRRIKRSERS